MKALDKAKELISKFNGKEKIEMIKISKSELEDLKSANKQYEFFFEKNNVDNKTKEEINKEAQAEVKKMIEEEPKKEIKSDTEVFKDLAEDTNKK